MKSKPQFNFLCKAAGRQIHLEQFGANGISWLHPSVPSKLFAVEVNGQLYHAANLECTKITEQAAKAGVQHATAAFSGPGFEVEQHFLVYDGNSLLETWPVLRCTGPQACQVSRLDSFSYNIPQASYELMTFASGWGNEFEPRHAKLTGKVVVESDAGRSSRLYHPWFALQRDGQEVFSGSIAWSGNWVFRFEPLEGTGWQVSGGLLEHGFQKVLQPGETVEGPPVALVFGSDLNEISQQYAAVGRKHWYPNNRLSRLMPVEWNHWWSYEDANLDEKIFSDNIAAAAGLGIEICTLDAGWFGPSDANTHWYDYRGDWHLVNDQRFPGGIRAISNQVHERGMHFGIWCEIEGLGIRAQLAQEHPDFVATRAGERLGCVCFGNPAVQEWAYQTLAHLIRDYQADWIKLDFNLDPGLGCDRSDHDHQAGDGLYEHYRGYSRTLERVRTDFPEVFLENCSSGGLRIDLGMLRQTHATFLSDPDWPVHDLQIFWGASCMLPAERLLHWSFSEWCMEKPPEQQVFNPHDPRLTRKQLDYYTRIAMLGMYGISQKLPELPAWVAERLAEHHRIYQGIVRRFIRQGNLYRLTDQPRRSGEGDRLCAFQYSLADSGEHLLFVFHLPGKATNQSIQLRDLQPGQRYTVEGLEGEIRTTLTGQELMAGGLSFADLGEEESALLRISS